MAEKEQNTDRSTIEEKMVSPEVAETQETPRSIFDAIGDLFAKMLKGIFVFIFCKLPLKFWRIIWNKRFFRYLYSIARVVFLGLLWVAVLFLGFFFGEIAGGIWMILALSGSAYGLLYVTLKRRARRKGKEFRGVFGWMRRRKKAEYGETDANADITPPPLPKE